jgi:hypothetical protein
VERGSNRQTHPFWSIGVMGTACRKGEPGNWGRPVMGEGSGLNVVAGRRLWRVSDRVVVLPRLGNSSGGKGPDFWYAFEGAEDW